MGYLADLCLHILTTFDFVSAQAPPVSQCLGGLEILVLRFLLIPYEAYEFGTRSYFGHWAGEHVLWTRHSPPP